MRRVLLLALALCGCADTTQKQLVWTRIDGKPVDPAKLQVAQTECRADATIAVAQWQQNQTMTDVMQACMTKAGYVMGTTP
jgi:hypothetical protein